MTALLDFQPNAAAELLALKGRGFRRGGCVLFYCSSCRSGSLENAERATKTHEGRAATQGRPPLREALGTPLSAVQHPPHTKHGLSLFKYTQIQLSGKLNIVVCADTGGTRRSRRTGYLTGSVMVGSSAPRRRARSMWKRHTRSLQVEPSEATNHFSFLRTRRHDVMNRSHKPHDTFRLHGAAPLPVSSFLPRSVTGAGHS